MIKNSLKHFIQETIWTLYHIVLEWYVRHIRKKGTIRFLFLLQELSQWKTEMLYKAMLNHPRFEPILGITTCLNTPGAELKVKEYCKEKGYEYVLIDPDSTIFRQIKVDLLSHQRPYGQDIHPKHRVSRNLFIPVVYIPYFLSTITEKWLVNQRLCLLAWRIYLDNDYCRDEWKRLHRLHGINYAVTGLPMMDELLMPKESFHDVWPNTQQKKRIIFAPHHTIANIHLEGIGYSTFLENADFMLRMKEKYRDQVYFVFKPHPRLYQNLLSIWEKEHVDAYYDSWNDPGFSHVDINNKYISLFKYSDALIHDCGSFTIEYLYTGNPVMYLTKNEHHKDNMTWSAAKAFDLHYKGRSHSEIESFIQSVISGFDPRKEDRISFRDWFLTPPNGKTASENIIENILGIKS